MSFPHASHPLWHRSLELVFDIFLELEHGTANPVLQRLRRAVAVYLETLQAGLSHDFGALITARNLLVQVRHHVVLARDLGLLARTFCEVLREHVRLLAPLFPKTGRA